MREHIQVSFFDEGTVLRNGQPVRFPYLKTQILFLMLLEAGKPVPRKRLCRVIWSEEPDKAKQNLRNALSALKKLLPNDCILADRQSVSIGDSVKITADLHEIDVEKLSELNIERLARPFLGNLQAAGETALWIAERGNHYEKKLCDVLKEKIETSGAEQGVFWNIWLQTLAAPAKELGRTVSRNNRMPFVRVEERDAILAFLRDASDANTHGVCRCEILYGEEGSGKSVLSKEIFGHMEQDGLLCFHGHPREGGQNYREVLGGILEQLLEGRSFADLNLPDLYESYLRTSFPGSGAERRASAQRTEDGELLPPRMDFNPHLLGRIFAFLFNRLGASPAKPVFLLMEDLHWSAHWMPDFLRGLFENVRVSLIALLTAYPEMKPALDLAFTPLHHRVHQNELLLSRLTFRQTEQICRLVLPSQLLTPEKLADIYGHTDGSPFLLGEFLRFYDAEDWSDKLSKSLNEIVHRRILSLTEGEKELLQCISIFPGEANFELLRELAGLSDAELLKRYEGLHRKGFLYDHASGNSYGIFFRYSLIKKQIKESMPKIKWWNLHKRLLHVYATAAQAPMDEKNLAQIAYHAGDYMAELDARVSELKKHFEFNHELFPKLSDAELFETPRMLNDTLLTANYLEEAQKRLDRLIRERGKTKELTCHEQTLLTIQGGYLRWNGDYASAANCLKEALRVALQRMERPEAVVDVLEQLCYLGIQQDDPKMLESYAFQFYRASQKARMAPQLGMALRFIAILGIMRGRHELAAKQLKMSLRLFERLESQGQSYTLSVIAATHYHGDIALYKGNYAEALGHYLQSAKLCEDKGFYRGLGIHLAKAAWCEFRLGQLDGARDHLAFARPLFEGYRSRRGANLCGGEIVFGLSALLALWNGDANKAYENLKSADELVSIIQKPLWEGLLCCIKALLKENAADRLHPLLQDQTELYVTRSREILSGIGLGPESEAYFQYRDRIAIK